MKVALISIAGLLLSLVMAASGMYGCTMRETSRWGQSEDLLTFVYAGSFYVGLVGIALAATCFVRAMISHVKRHRD